MQKTQEQTRTKAGLLATIGLLATLAIGCVPVYHVNRPSEKADEIHYLMKDCHGNNMHVSHRQLMNQPGLRRMYEEQTGKTFVP